MNLENFAVKASDLVEFMNSKLSYDVKDKTDRSGVSVSVDLIYKVPISEFMEFIGKKAKPEGQTQDVTYQINLARFGPDQK